MTPQHRAHRRHRLCRRDQEGGVLAVQLPRPAARRAADALLGQCRRRRRRRAVLRPLGHRQDDALAPIPTRPLIGDDEHRLERRRRRSTSRAAATPRPSSSAPRPSPRSSPRRRRFGTVLENVVLDDERRARFRRCLADRKHPRRLSARDAAGRRARAASAATPKTVVFLTADAFGVLPPIARLTPEQAVYHFLSGYTAKVAGTERGVTEPQATFSACFGAPFMPLHPQVYGDLLRRTARRERRQRLADQYRLDRRRLWHRQAHRHRRHPPAGRRGAVGRTRRRRRCGIDPNFGFAVPLAVEGVPERLLDPRANWADAAAYDAAAASLAAMFDDNCRGSSGQRGGGVGA